jgi:hypothetical protein
MMRRTVWILFALVLAAALLLASPFGVDEARAAEEEGFTSEDQSGNDPREFSSKFMPYYRSTQLKNGVKQQEFTLFGFYAFTSRFGMTYEWAMAKRLEFGNAAPPMATDTDQTGMGDLGLRFFLRPRSGEFAFMDGKKNISLMPLVELFLPTATEDMLGGDAFIVSPGFVFVTDMPFEKPPLGLGFFAMMNFYDFDAFKEDEVGYTSRYRGRWFWMQPFSMPAFMKNPKDVGVHILDLSGLYLLAEFQPIYDFRKSDFDFWIGPEVGKILQEGLIFYAKPGFGIDQDDEDRQFTLEFGMRYFMN